VSTLIWIKNPSNSEVWFECI